MRITIVVKKLYSDIILIMVEDIMLLPVQACEFGTEKVPPHGHNRKYLCSHNRR